MIEAKMVLDSVSATGRRISTIQFRVHKYSTNHCVRHGIMAWAIESSRARGVKTMIGRAADELAYPVSWRREQRGMYAGERL